MLGPDNFIEEPESKELSSPAGFKPDRAHHPFRSIKSQTLDPSASITERRKKREDSVRKCLWWRN